MEPIVLRVTIALIVSIVPILVFCIARLAFQQNTCLIAALLSSTYPFHLWLTKQPNSEIPFLVFFLSAVYLFAKSMQAPQPAAWRALIMGVLLGMASLTRPIAIGLSLSLLAAMWLFGPGQTRRAKILFSCIVLFGNFVVVFPWEVVAREKTGHWILLSTGGPPGVVDGLTFAVNNNASSKTLFVSADVRALMLEILAQKEQLESMSAIVRSVKVQFIRKPSTVMKLFLLKVARSWYANDRQSLEQWILFLQVPYVLLAGAGVYIAMHMGAQQRRFTCVMLVIVVYFWTMTFVSLSILRYMVPAMLLLMPFVSLSAITAKNAVWARSKRLGATDLRAIPVS